MSESIMYARSKMFASRVVRMHIFLQETKREFVLSKQVLRSGTSIGANLAEAEFAASTADFANKKRIALKECSETLYWLELLNDGGFLPAREYNSIRNDCEQLLKMLVASIKTISTQICKETEDTYDAVSPLQGPPLEF